MEAQRAAPAIQILRLPEVCKVTGMSRSTIYLMESQAKFPRRMRIGIRAVGWVEAEVQGWIADRVRPSRSTAHVPEIRTSHASARSL